MWRHKAELAVVESQDRVAILDLHHLADPARILESSAAAIWRAVDGERPTSDLVVAVAQSFGLQPSHVAADVVGFLRSLAAAGLLEEAG